MDVDHIALKFSIILPVRNGGEHIKLCVSSILAQTYHDFELIILENCSSDDTVEWLKTVTDDRVNIFPAEKPLSLEDNWSRISSIQTNEFITIIGHDDLFCPNYLEVMSALIKENPTATLYQTHFRYIDEAGEFLRHCLPICKILQAHEFVAQQFTRTLDSMGTGYMMRRKDFEKVGGLSKYPNLIFGDYELWVKLIEPGYMVTDPAECFSYREHTSASASTGVAVYQACLFKYLFFLDGLAKDNYLLRNVIKRYGQDYLAYMCEALIYRSITVRRTTESKTALQIATDFDALNSDITASMTQIVDVNLRVKAGVLIDRWLIGRLTYVLVLKLKHVMKYFFKHAIK